MDTPPITPANPATAGLAALCVTAQVSDQARALLRAGAATQPGEFVQTLMAREQYQDAVRLIAHALPRREAVWWAWVCARRAAGETPPPEIAAALAATERWIAHPDDANRRAAMEAAEAADLGTPAGCAGLAAFFSGGSVAPPEAPATPPGEHLTARAVSGGVMLAAVTGEPERAAEKYKAFLQQGLDVAARVGAWGAAAPTA
jgi:hypothetical protein